MGEQDRHKRAVAVALKVFPGGKVRLTRSNVSGQADFTIKTNEHLLTVEVKALSTTRISDLEGKLASATLTAQRVAKKGDSQPVAMIELPRLGPKSMDFARRFMAREAPEVGWCLFDLEGAYRFEIPPLAVVQSGKPRSRSEPRPQPVRGTLFSDLHRWMLKILLMREVPQRFWGGPAQSIQSVKDLATVAKVSPQTAYSFLRTFEAAGYVRETSEGIAIVRRGELMRAWLNHDAAFHASRIPVCSILGAGQDLQKLVMRSDGSEQFAVTGFEACRLLGVLHAPVPQREICLQGDIEAAIHAWKLKQCEARDADLFLSKMAYPKSVLRGRTMKENLPVVDIMEAALSVFPQTPRGREQASYLFQHVLQWEDCV